MTFVSTMESTSSKPLNFTVVTCFIAYLNKFLVLKRARKDPQFGLWGIPGGKLDDDEPLEIGLAREILEETGLRILPEKFQKQSTAYITNPYDGHYCIYIYFVKLKLNPNIIINQNEHSSYKWVTIEDFKKLNLLVSQAQAFELVEDKLPTLLKS